MKQITRADPSSKPYHLFELEMKVMSVSCSHYSQDVDPRAVC